MATEKPNLEISLGNERGEVSAFDLTRSLRIRSQMNRPSTDRSAADLQH